MNHGRQADKERAENERQNLFLHGMRAHENENIPETFKRPEKSPVSNLANGRFVASWKKSFTEHHARALSERMLTPGETRRRLLSELDVHPELTECRHPLMKENTWQSQTSSLRPLPLPSAAEKRAVAAAARAAAENKRQHSAQGLVIVKMSGLCLLIQHRRSLGCHVAVLRYYCEAAMPC